MASQPRKSRRPRPNDNDALPPAKRVRGSQNSSSDTVPMDITDGSSHDDQMQVDSHAVDLMPRSSSSLFLPSDMISSIVDYLSIKDVLSLVLCGNHALNNHLFKSGTVKTIDLNLAEFLQNPIHYSGFFYLLSNLESLNTLKMNCEGLYSTSDTVFSPLLRKILDLSPSNLLHLILDSLAPIFHYEPSRKGALSAEDRLPEWWTPTVYSSYDGQTRLIIDDDLRFDHSRPFVIYMFNFSIKFPNLVSFELPWDHPSSSLETTPMNRPFYTSFFSAMLPSKLQKLHYFQIPSLLPNLTELPQSITELLIEVTDDDEYSDVRSVQDVIKTCVNLRKLKIPIPEIPYKTRPKFHRKHLRAENHPGLDDAMIDQMSKEYSIAHPRFDRSIVFPESSKITEMELFFNGEASEEKITYPPLLKDLSLVFYATNRIIPVIKALQNLEHLERLYIVGDVDIDEDLGNHLPSSIKRLCIETTTKELTRSVLIDDNYASFFQKLPNSLVYFGANFWKIQTEDLDHLPNSIEYLELPYMKVSATAFSSLPKSITSFVNPNTAFYPSCIHMIPRTIKNLSIGVNDWTDLQVHELQKKFNFDINLHLYGVLHLTGSFLPPNTQEVNRFNLVESFEDKTKLICRTEHQHWDCCLRQAPAKVVCSQPFEPCPPSHFEKKLFPAYSKDYNFSNTFFLRSPIQIARQDFPASVTSIDFLKDWSPYRTTYISKYEIIVCYPVKLCQRLPNLTSLSFSMHSSIPAGCSSLFPQTLRKLRLELNRAPLDLDFLPTSLTDLTISIGLESHSTKHPGFLITLMYTYPRLAYACRIENGLSVGPKIEYTAKLPALKASKSKTPVAPPSQLEKIHIVGKFPNLNRHLPLIITNATKTIIVPNSTSLEPHEILGRSSKLEVLDISDQPLNFESLASLPDTLTELRVLDLKPGLSPITFPKRLRKLCISGQFDTTIISHLPSTLKVLLVKDFVLSLDLLTKQHKHIDTLDSNVLCELIQIQAPRVDIGPIAWQHLEDKKEQDIQQSIEQHKTSSLVKKFDGSCMGWSPTPESLKSIPKWIKHLNLISNCRCHMIGQPVPDIGSKEKLSAKKIAEMDLKHLMELRREFNFSWLPNNITKLSINVQLELTSLRSLPSTLTSLTYLVEDVGIWSYLPENIKIFETKLDETLLTAANEKYLPEAFGWVYFVPNHLEEFTLHSKLRPYSTNMERGAWAEFRLSDLPSSLTRLRLPVSSLLDLTVSMLPKTIRHVEICTLVLTDHSIEYLVSPGAIPNTIIQNPEPDTPGPSTIVYPGAPRDSDSETIQNILCDDPAAKSLFKLRIKETCEWPTISTKAFWIASNLKQATTIIENILDEDDSYNRWARFFQPRPGGFNFFFG